jgi:hypothetical protein
VKIREGRLETKLRTRSYGAFDLADQSIRGELESWTKWSVAFGVEPPGEQLLAETGWLAVKKHRFLRSFEVTADGMQEIADRPTNGCEVEFTILQTAGQTWWTIGLEANGPSGDLRRNLGMVALATVGALQVTDLFRVENSYSYPVWLAEIAGQNSAVNGQLAEG